MASPARFTVEYHLVALDEGAARSKARDICIEQTVEVPEQIVAGTWIEEQIVGRIDKLELKDAAANVWRVMISYPEDAAGEELPQLMNVLFGLTCQHAEVQLVDFQPSPGMSAWLPGPRFGIEGLRRLCGVPAGPMLCTALKPMGRSVEELAAMAYSFAMGGIDIIKDDDGLQNQRWAPFEARITAVARAVAKANAETGRRCLYAPCLNSPAHLLLERAMYAKRAGAGAVLMLPGITGFDGVRLLAANADFGLPILCHPAYLGMVGGSNTPGTPVHGFAHRVQQALLPRIAGCDVTIFLNTGSRFAMTQAECLSIAQACAAPLGECRPMFPCPAGGMALDSTQHQVSVYGQDVMLLIGGSLLTESPDLEANARKFARLAGRS
eukprot:jgi/Tetstr1/421772/TSEL_012675.t1